jgi:hypothetical protein
VETLEIARGVIELGLLAALLLVVRELRLLRREIPQIRSAVLQPRLLDFPAESSTLWRRRKTP